MNGGVDKRDMREEYINGLIKIISDDHPSPIAEVVRARIDKDHDQKYGLISPPLDRDEPDQYAIFLPVFDYLLKEKPAGAAKLRRELFEILDKEFDSENFSEEVQFRIDRLSRLLAYGKVYEDEALVGRLRRSMWGTFTGYTEDALKEFSSLGSPEQKRVLSALDLWLAATPYCASSSKPRGFEARRALIEKYYVELLKGFESEDAPSWDAWEFLLLLYRAMMKVAPEKCGESYFWRMCHLARADASNSVLPKFRSGWRGLCWEYGKVFEANTAWGNKFFAELTKTASMPTIKITDGNISLAEIRKEDLKLMLGYLLEKGGNVFKKLDMKLNHNENGYIIDNSISSDRDKLTKTITQELYINHGDKIDHSRVYPVAGHA